MKQLVVLTTIWISALLLSLLLVEFFILRKTVEGYRILLAEDRWESVRPLLTLYGTYVAGILAFWFSKPFKAPKSDRAKRIRYRLALVCTVVFNLIVLYLVGQKHLNLDFGLDTVVDDIHGAVKLGGWMSFLVAPVNAFYFGTGDKKS